jgi:PKD repeat protein
MKSSRTIFGWLAGLAAVAMALGLLPVVMLADAAVVATTSVHIIKYAADGTTVLDEKTVTYQQMRDTMTVLGDGTTHYYLQGPVFVDDPDPQTQEMLRWNQAEDTNLKDFGALRGTNVKNLCNLVGGMSVGDDLKVRSSDGWNRTYAYQNVYQYSSREGPMVLTWEKDGKYPDTGYSEGMRLVWFASASVNPFGYHAFGNWDWHEAADAEYWYYYSGQYPTTTGLSGQYVSDLIIYSNVPANYAITASAGANGSVSPAGSVPVAYGGSQSYSITPSPGYQVADVLVDGRSKGAVTSYMFTNVTTDHTISATFAPSAPPPPAADFSADATSGTAPLTVHFTDRSTGSPTSWAWDFDNNGTADSTARNPTHAYNAAGTYSVKLTVTNAGGNDSEEKGSYITVTEPEPLPPGPPAPPAPPAAAFSADATSGAAPLTVQFSDNSTGNPAAWEWDFDNDGDIDSTEQNPAHTYGAAGTYVVRLTVANSGGSDSEEKMAYIAVTEPEFPAPEPPPAEPEAPALALPVAAFTSDVVSGPAPLTVLFTDISTGNPTAWEWDFDNDGDIDSTDQNPTHTFDAAGTCVVKLTVSNPAGSDSEMKTDCISVTAPGSSGSWMKDRYALIVAGAAVLAAAAGVAAYALKARGGLR